ncbi:MAG: hypothetical protein HUJ71_02195 [Pseudobutyrivibrio sp.]|nr:hypothetical protein [Pseudobutyrivibrio sp.]
MKMNFSIFVNSACLDDVVYIKDNCPNIPNIEYFDISLDNNCEKWVKLVLSEVELSI